MTCNNHFATNYWSMLIKWIKVLSLRRASPSGSAVQQPKEAWLLLVSGEDPLEKGVAAHSSILAWRIPGTEPGGSIGPQRIRHNWSNLAHMLVSKKLKVRKLYVDFKDFRDEPSFFFFFFEPSIVNSASSLSTLRKAKIVVLKSCFQWKSSWIL